MIDVKPSLKTVLKRLKLSGLAPTLPDRATYAVKAGLHPLDFLEPTLQDEIDRRERTNLSHRLDRAGFTEQQVLEDFEWDAPISFDRDRIHDLFGLGFLDRREDIIFLGPVGTGKSFLACALGHSACRLRLSTRYFRPSRLLGDLAIARGDGTYTRVLERLARTALLVIDDFGLAPLKDSERRDLLEVLEDRYGQAATLVTSQLPFEHWHEAVADPTLADAILDRLVHHAHRISLKGPSMRAQKPNGRTPARKEDQQ